LAIEDPSKRSVTIKGRIQGGSYCAPELLDNDPIFDPKSDVWAFGCILFEMVTQQKVFAGEQQAWQYSMSPKLFRISPPDQYVVVNKTSASKSLDVLINDILHKTPGKRPSGDELVNRIEIRIPAGRIRDPGKIRRKHLA